jgi:secondary thiamine-phosphate synthase enzyme
MAESATIEVKTRGFCDVIDITSRVESFVRERDVEEGAVLVFTPGATAGVTTIEYESGAVADLKRAFERLIPSDIEYEHNLRWGDGNGFSHVRASFLGPSLVVPVERGVLVLGTWQQIVVVDFDNHPRNRNIYLRVLH